MQVGMTMSLWGWIPVSKADMVDFSFLWVILSVWMSVCRGFSECDFGPLDSVSLGKRMDDSGSEGHWDSPGPTWGS